MSCITKASYKSKDEIIIITDCPVICRTFLFVQSLSWAVTAIVSVSVCKLKIKINHMKNVIIEIFWFPCQISENR